MVAKCDLSLSTRVANWQILISDVIRKRLGSGREDDRLACWSSLQSLAPERLVFIDENNLVRANYPIHFLE